MVTVIAGNIDDLAPADVDQEFDQADLRSLRVDISGRSCRPSANSSMIPLQAEHAKRRPSAAPLSFVVPGSGQVAALCL